MELLNRVSPEVEAKIIEMWFQGFPRDEIARILMVGEGTVTEKSKSLPPCLEPLRDLSKALRKLNLLPSDALKGVKLLQLLVERGATPEQIPISLEAIEKTCGEAGYKPEEVIQASIELAELENLSGREYPQALEVFKTLTQQTPELKRQNSQLQLEIEENRRLRNETLERANTTPKELSEFLDCKSALRGYGMDISGAKTIRKVLDNIKEAGSNAKHLVSLIKKHGSIAKSVAHMERQLLIKQDEHTNLLSQIRECRQTVFQLQGEQEQKESIINSQRHAINVNNCQLNLVQANIAQVERRRQALITWIGKKLDMPQELVERLRLDSEYEIVLEAIDNALRDTIRSRYGA